MATDTFGLLYPSGVPFKGIFTSAVMTSIDERWPKIPNWIGGSEHTLDANATVVLHGTPDDANMFTLDLPVNIAADQTLTILSTATLALPAGAVFSVYTTEDVESGGKVRVKSGATLQVDAGAGSTNASVLGVQLTGTQPTKTADPGANNIAIATNQVKAWGDITIGNNAFVTNDGMNIASIAIDGGNKAKVTFARAMANANYSIAFGGTTNAAIPVAEKADKTTTYFKIGMIDTSTFSPTPISLGAVSTAWNVCFMVLGRQ